MEAHPDRKQHPFLATLKPPAVGDKADLYAWLVEAERIHGENLSVTALTNWVHQDPGAELLDRILLSQLPVIDEKAQESP